MHLLLVEDKDSFRRLLVQALDGSGWTIHAVAHPREALEILASSPCEIMVTDLRLPEMSGLELLKRAKRLHPGLRVLLMSAFGEPSDIVEAMAFGAEDFLAKPFDLDDFQAILERMSALTEAPSPDPREPWVALSASMRPLDHALANLAESTASTLFIGERGSGRSRSARRLHTLRHPKAPFLDLDATSLGAAGVDPRRLSMLKGGSIHLKNLEAISPEGAQGLLKILGNSEHCWSASAPSLERVPPALRTKLGTLVLTLPPLRERREDVLPLFRAALERNARRLGRMAPALDQNIERDLLSRPWPGNVTELIWLAERAMSQSTGPLLSALPLYPGDGEGLLELAWPRPSTLDNMLTELTKQAEAQLLQRALRHHGFHLPEAAQALGLTQRTFAQRLREHRIALEHAGEESS